MSGLVEAISEQTSGSNTGSDRPVSLVMPCKAEYVSLCRLVAGAVGANALLDEETIADLKLVVTEACACFVCRSSVDRIDDGTSDEVSGTAEISNASRSVSFPGNIRVDFRVTPEYWEIVVSDPDHQCRTLRLSECDPMSEGGLGLTIIKALADSVEQAENEAGGGVLRLVKRLPPRMLAV